MSAASARSGLRVVVVGATGALGKEVVAALAASSLPIAELIPVGTERSIGSDVDFRGEQLYVASELPALQRVDLIVLCTPGAASLEIIRQALHSEVACIDCSGVLAGSDDVPQLIASLCSPADAAAPVICVPNGVVTGWAYVLAALDKAAGVERVVGTIVQSATHAGRAGIDVLSTETIALLTQSEPPESDVFPTQVAFDCIPVTGPLDADESGSSVFESALRRDLRRIVRADLEVGISTIQVPTFVGEGSTLAIETAEAFSVEDALLVLEKAPGVDLWREPGSLPSTRETAGRDEALVARVRRDPSHARGLLLWLATDGLCLVASNVVRLAEMRLRLN